MAEGIPENKKRLNASSKEEVKIHIKSSAKFIAVASGKGGVGKSTVAVNIAAAIARKDFKVGILDADVYGFTIPKMLGIIGQPKAIAEDQILPLEKHGIKVMSMGFLVKETQPVIWRGPMIHKAIKQILTQTLWGDLDYLIIDLPPGTGDVAISLGMLVPDMSIIIVTTPQDVSSKVACRALRMAKTTNLKILGIIENMSYFICRKCGEKAYIFGQGGGEDLAREEGVPFLGEIPLEQSIREGSDSGRPLAFEESDSPAKKTFEKIVSKILKM
ncbi:MAG: P-loop NTPase [Methanococcoides sp.]|nr:P-loop NTPase [Methanococcoides sp.]